MELSIIKLNKDENNIIDAYNKNRLLLNILNRLVLKLRGVGDEEALVNFYDEMNSLFLIENKFCIREENDHNVGDNISTSISKNYQEEMFPCLLFLDRDDFRNFVDKEKSLRNLNSISTENLKLLSLFEEEIRKFLKGKKKFLDRLKCKRNATPKESENNGNSLTCDSRKNISSLMLENSYEEIFKKFIQNFEFINDIYKKFKNTQTQQEAKELLFFETNLDSMKNLLEKLMNSITEDLSGEKSLKVFYGLRKQLTEGNNGLLNEINELKFEINRFTEEGDDLIELVKEYKKICNMIDCKKR